MTAPFRRLLLALCLLAGLPTALSAELPPPEKEELNVGVQLMPSHLNPLIQHRQPVLLLSTQLFASPLRRDAEGRAAPYLARAWQVAEDGLSVTLKLVEGARFHDDTPIASADVAFSLLALRDNHPLRELYQAIETVETPDPLTAVIRLRHPHPALETMLSAPFSPIVPKHIFGDGQPLAAHPANQAPVGSGPFRVERFEPAKRLELVRFEGYNLAARPSLERLRFINFGLDGDPNLWLQHGRIHLDGMAYPGNPGFQEVADDPGLRLLPGGGGEMVGTSGLLFNVARPPMNDRRVRQAIALGFDRNRMLELVAKGQDPPQLGPIPNDNPFYTPVADPYPFDPDRANALLDQAGYPKDERGVRFTLRLGFVPSMRMMDWAGEYLRFELQRTLGIAIDIQRATSVQEWATRLVKGDFDLDFWATLTFGDPLTGIHRLYRTRPAGPIQFNSNPANYSNPEVDRLLDQAAAEPDLDRRKAIYAEFQRLILEDLPLISVSRFELYTVHHRDLLGLELSPWGTIAPYDRLHWRR